MLFDTAEEYTAEIALVRASIRRTMESQKYGLSRGGSASESQRVPLPDLEKYLTRLIAERDSLTESSGAPMRLPTKPGRRF